MQRLTDEEFSELERLEKAATPGPWEFGTAMCCPDAGWISSTGGSVCPQSSAKLTHSMDAWDAELCTAARNALPSLLAEVRELRAARLHDCPHCPCEGGARGIDGACAKCGGLPDCEGEK